MSLTPQKLGSNVRRRREDLNWSQDKAAKECGLSVRSYCAIERGEANSKFLTLVKISEGLKMDIADLFRDD